jgi:hypothetical protein
VISVDVLRGSFLVRIVNFIELLLLDNTSLFCANLIMSFLFNRKWITSAFLEEKGSIAIALPPIG